MRSRDRLVEAACRRAAVTRQAARESASLTHPERPARGVAIGRYTADTLELELRELEARYGTSSEAFMAAYRAGKVSPGVAGSEAFRWADTYCEWRRLGGVAAEPAR
jgi:hypothetical protein